MRACILVDISQRVKRPILESHIRKGIYLRIHVAMFYCCKNPFYGNYKIIASYLGRKLLRAQLTQWKKTEFEESFCNHFLFRVEAYKENLAQSGGISRKSGSEWGHIKKIWLGVGENREQLSSIYAILIKYDYFICGLQSMKMSISQYEIASVSSNILFK